MYTARAISSAQLFVSDLIEWRGLIVRDVRERSVLGYGERRVRDACITI
jgi:hypothetical protein